MSAQVQETTSGRAEVAGDRRFAEPWRPPARSIATRFPSRRSRGSGRATLVGGAPPRRIRCESDLEHKALRVLLARRDVAAVQEQPRPIAFVDEDERVTSHRFDFLSRFTDGRRIAFEVKPAEKAERHRWKERLTLIAAQSDGLADGYGLLTERELTPTLVANATLILAVRRDPRPDHDAIVRAIVRRALGQMRIADIVAASGLGGDGFRAVARLIDAGELSLVDRVRIDYPAWVVWAGANQKETLQ
jgi:hypothetical protein